MPKNIIKQNDKIHLDACLYGIYAAIIPLNMIMNLSGQGQSGTGTVNKQLGIFTAVLMILFIFALKRFKKKRDPNWGLIFFTIYSVLSIAWSVEPTITISALTTLLSLILIYWVGKIREFNEKETFVICLFMIVLGSVLPFFLGINTTVSYSRGTLMNETGAADPNGLACNLVFVAIIALDLFFKTGTAKLKYLFGAASGIITVGVFLTGSRGALAGLGIASVYYLLTTFLKTRNNRSFGAGTLFFMIIGFTAIFIYLENNLSEAILRRFSLATAVDDRGSGRLDTWIDIFKIIKNDPIKALFGWGYGTQKSVYAVYYGGIERASHNAFLQIWLDVGIIGLIAFIIGTFKFWSDASRKHVVIVKTLWIALFVALMTLTFGTNKGTWNVFLLMYLITLHSTDSAEDNRLSKREEVIISD